MKKVIIIALFCIFFVTEYSAQVHVIANKSISESTLSASTLANIYSLGMSKWANGSKIVVIDQSSEGAAKTAFYKYIGKEPLTLKKEWMKKQLTGEAKAPESIGSEDEIINKVAGTPGAIGYVKSSVTNSNVKVVAEIK